MTAGLDSSRLHTTVSDIQLRKWVDDLDVFEE